MPESSLTWVAGYRRSQLEETTHHLFARSRTPRIKLTCGFSISIVISILPLHAVLNYCWDLSDFHGVSRAERPYSTYMEVGDSPICPVVGQLPRYRLGGDAEPGCQRHCRWVRHYLSAAIADE